MNNKSGLHATTPSRCNFSPSSVCSPSSVTKIFDKGIDKKLLTPCRRVGLKRKSACSLKKQTCNDETLTDSKSSYCSKTKTSHGLSEQSEVCKKISLQLTSENEPLTCNGEISFITENHIQCNDIVVPKNMKKCDPTSISSVNPVPVKNIFKNADLLSFSKSENTRRDVCNKDKPDFVTLELLESLARSIKDKKEKCKHLEITNLYAKKHDLKMLEELTLKWKQGCQEALNEIHSILSEKGHNISLSAVLNQFQIPHSVINYNEDTDEFE